MPPKHTTPLYIRLTNLCAQRLCCALQWISYYPAQDDMGLCLSFGDQPLAMCAAEQPLCSADLYDILLREGNEAIYELMMTGQLMPVENPADTATAYKQACSPEPVV